MGIEDILSIALAVVYVLVGLAVIWLIFELVMTARKARKTVNEMQKQIEPTLKHVENITASLEPVSAKVDPLVERVSLTVDAANLELMRVDQILEDVGEITDTVSSTVHAVDTVASTPLEIANSLSTKVRSMFKTSHASSESVDLGQEKAERDAEAQNQMQNVPDEQNVASSHGQHVAPAATSQPQVSPDEAEAEGEKYFTYAESKVNK